MTCIIAIKNKDGSVTLGADKLGSNGHTKTMVVDPKIFKNGDFYFGFTSSFFMGQLLKYKFSPPPMVQGQDIDSYLFVTVREALTKLFVDAKFGSISSEKNDEPVFGTYILVYQGRIFKVLSNTSIIELSDVVSVGCGAETALGAIYALREAVPDMESSEMIRLAMVACDKTLCGVSKEYDIIEIPA